MNDDDDGGGGLICRLACLLVMISWFAFLFSSFFFLALGVQFAFYVQ